MTMRELEIQFQNAMNELQSSRTATPRMAAELPGAAATAEEAKQREAALRAQNEQLARN